MPRLRAQVDMSGPFFQADPTKTFRQNVRRMLQGVAEEGAVAVRALWPKRTGAGAAGTIGRVASMSGKPWALTAVISPQHVYRWPRGSQKAYRGGKVERRVGMFRRTASALRSSRAVLAANLTKGLE